MNSITPNLPESQQSNVTNWKEIDLSKSQGLIALKRVIALYQGWEIIPSTHDTDRSDPVYDVIDPDGNELEIMFNEIGLQSVWYSSRIPDWPKDATAAFDLIPHVPFALHKLPNGLWRASIVDGALFEAIAGTPALATCIVWLKWVDDEGGQS